MAFHYGLQSQTLDKSLQLKQIAVVKTNFRNLKIVKWSTKPILWQRKINHQNLWCDPKFFYNKKDYSTTL